MRTNQQRYLYEQLELIKPPVSTPNRFQQRFLEIMQRVWTQLANPLIANETRFEEVLDKNGRTSWKVYDSVTSQTFYLNSLPAVLEWIEERHNPNSLFDR